jgi:hypothetical protein
MYHDHDHVHNDEDDSTSDDATTAMSPSNHDWHGGATDDGAIIDIYIYW